MARKYHFIIKNWNRFIATRAKFKTLSKAAQKHPKTFLET